MKLSYIVKRKESKMIKKMLIQKFWVLYHNMGDTVRLESLDGDKIAVAYYNTSRVSLRIVHSSQPDEYITVCSGEPSDCENDFRKIVDFLRKKDVLIDLTE